MNDDVIQCLLRTHVCGSNDSNHLNVFKAAMIDESIEIIPRPISTVVVLNVDLVARVQPLTERLNEVPIVIPLDQELTRMR